MPLQKNVVAKEATEVMDMLNSAPLPAQYVKFVDLSNGVYTVNRVHAVLCRGDRGQWRSIRIVLVSSDGTNLRTFLPAYQERVMTDEVLKVMEKGQWLMEKQENDRIKWSISTV